MNADEDELLTFLDEFYSFEPVSYESYRLQYPFDHDGINPMFIVDELPDNDIKLVIAPPLGIIFVVRGEEYFYTWDSGVLPPKMITPRMSLSDYDHDGVDELAIIFLDGSGTGCTYEKLVIVEVNEGMETQRLRVARHVSNSLVQR